MKIDIKEVVEAWLTKATATESEKQLAEARLAICNGCDKRTHNDTFGYWYCAECGCPLKGKSFSKRENACPLKKWASAEVGFFIQKINKEKSHLI